MASINDGNAHSNGLFWDSNHGTTFRRFVPWKMISKCSGIGYEGSILYIFIKKGRLDFPYVDEETMFANLERLMKEISQLPGQGNALVEKVEKMYYAPGMPGFEEAKESFQNETNREQELHNEMEEISGMCDKCTICDDCTKSV